MEISSIVELLTPLVPQYFLIIASTANIGKSDGGVDDNDDGVVIDCYYDDADVFVGNHDNTDGDCLL